MGCRLFGQERLPNQAEKVDTEQDLGRRFKMDSPLKVLYMNTNWDHVQHRLRRPGTQAGRDVVPKGRRAGPCSRPPRTKGIMYSKNLGVPRDSKAGRDVVPERPPSRAMPAPVQPRVDVRQRPWGGAGRQTSGGVVSQSRRAGVMSCAPGLLG